jgi:hypothetical protein
MKVVTEHLLDVLPGAELAWAWRSLTQALARA